MVDTQKIKGKESKHAHTENHQLRKRTKEEMNYEQPQLTK